MQNFQRVFGTKQCSIIGMIHVKALPGTPKYDGNFNAIIDQAKHEASIYRKHQIDAILVENMHDVPYVQDKKIGWEVVASMTRLCSEIKSVLSPRTPCGIQILASANCQALAVAKAADLQFIRAEGFVFSHIADEGFTDACAGDVLRYRKQIDAENVLVFTDLKKKHSSHAITNDVSLAETAHAAEFFMTDGIILTGETSRTTAKSIKLPHTEFPLVFIVGSATGFAVDVNDLKSIHKKVTAPILIGSGVTSENLREYFYKSNAAIIGSYFKRDGHWSGELCGEKIAALMDKVAMLRNKKD